MLTCIRYGLAAVSLNMLMAVLAIEWSLLVHGFLHLHFDVCDGDMFNAGALQKNISDVQHLADQGSKDFESLFNNSNEKIDEHQLGMGGDLNETQHQNNNCNPSWPWININLHRWMMMIKLVRAMMMKMMMM